MALTTVHHLSKMDVIDRQGDKVGRIRDILLDAETGRCDYLLVSTDAGGPLSIGGRDNLTPVPISYLTWRGDYLGLDADRDVFRGAPTFSPDDVASFPSDYRDKLDRFWGVGVTDRTRHTAAGTAPSAARAEDVRTVRPEERSSGEIRSEDVRTARPEEGPYRRSDIDDDRTRRTG